MFSKNNEKGKKFSFADSISTVAGSMKILGDVEAEHDMRIDGHIVGNVYCKAKVVLGPSGQVEGDLHANNADVFGKVKGNVITDDMLSLKNDSTVSGNITIGRLSIEPGANFNGKCTMSSEQTSKTYVTEDEIMLQEN